MTVIVTTAVVLLRRGLWPCGFRCPTL